MLAVPYVPRAGLWELSLCPPHRGSPSQNSRILDPPPGPDLQPVKKMRKFSQRQPENFLKASPPFVRRKLLNKLGTRITFSSRHLIWHTPSPHIMKTICPLPSNAMTSLVQEHFKDHFVCTYQLFILPLLLPRPFVIWTVLNLPSNSVPCFSCICCLISDSSFSSCRKAQLHINNLPTLSWLCII